MDFGSFVDINIFVMKYYEILCYIVSAYSPFFSNLLNKNLKVSFNDTLLNFGLKGLFTFYYDVLVCAVNPVSLIS